MIVTIGMGLMSSKQRLWLPSCLAFSMSHSVSCAAPPSNSTIRDRRAGRWREIKSRRARPRLFKKLLCFLGFSGNLLFCCPAQDLDCALGSIMTEDSNFDPPNPLVVDEEILYLLEHDGADLIDVMGFRIEQ